jgi:hypothetical protein
MAGQVAGSHNARASNGDGAARIGRAVSLQEAGNGSGVAPGQSMQKVRDHAHGTEHLPVSRAPAQRLDDEVAERRRRRMLDRVGKRTVRVEQALRAKLPAAEQRHGAGAALGQDMQRSGHGGAVEGRAVAAPQLRPTMKKLSKIVCGCASPSSENMTPHLSGRMSSGKSSSTRQTQYQPRQTDGLLS